MHQVNVLANTLLWDGGCRGWVDGELWPGNFGPESRILKGVLGLGLLSGSGGVWVGAVAVSPSNHYGGGGVVLSRGGLVPGSARIVLFFIFRHWGVVGAVVEDVLVLRVELVW